MKKTFLIITLSLFSITSFSQSWYQLMYDTNATFFDVQNAFYQEWGDQPYERGKGYKQFKRLVRIILGTVRLIILVAPILTRLPIQQDVTVQLL